MIANRRSTCGLCRDRIIANTDRIARWGVRWVHEDCYRRQMERAFGAPLPPVDEEEA